MPGRYFVWLFLAISAAGAAEVCIGGSMPSLSLTCPAIVWAPYQVDSKWVSVVGSSANINAGTNATSYVSSPFFPATMSAKLEGTYFEYVLSFPLPSFGVSAWFKPTTLDPKINTTLFSISSCSTGYNFNAFLRGSLLSFVGLVNNSVNTDLFIEGAWNHIQIIPVYGESGHLFLRIMVNMRSVDWATPFGNYSMNTLTSPTSVIIGGNVRCTKPAHSIDATFQGLVDDFIIIYYQPKDQTSFFGDLTMNLVDTIESCINPVLDAVPGLTTLRNLYKKSLVYVPDTNGYWIDKSGIRQYVPRRAVMAYGRRSHTGRARSSSISVPEIDDFKTGLSNFSFGDYASLLPTGFTVHFWFKSFRGRNIMYIGGRDCNGIEVMETSGVKKSAGAIALLVPRLNSTTPCRVLIAPNAVSNGDWVILSVSISPNIISLNVGGVETQKDCQVDFTNSDKWALRVPSDCMGGTGSYVQAADIIVTFHSELLWDTSNMVVEEVALWGPPSTFTPIKVTSRPFQYDAPSGTWVAATVVGRVLPSTSSPFEPNTFAAVLGPGSSIVSTSAFTLSSASFVVSLWVAVTPTYSVGYENMDTTRSILTIDTGCKGAAFYYSKMTLALSISSSDKTCLTSIPITEKSLWRWMHITLHFSTYSYFSIDGIEAARSPCALTATGLAEISLGRKGCLQPEDSPLHFMADDVMILQGEWGLPAVGRLLHCAQNRKDADIWIPNSTRLSGLQIDPTIASPSEISSFATLTPQAIASLNSPSDSQYRENRTVLESRLETAAAATSRSVLPVLSAGSTGVSSFGVVSMSMSMASKCSIPRDPSPIFHPFGTPWMNLAALYLYPFLLSGIEVMFEKLHGSVSCPSKTFNLMDTIIAGIAYNSCVLLASETSILKVIGACSLLTCASLLILGIWVPYRHIQEKRLKLSELTSTISGYEMPTLEKAGSLFPPSTDEYRTLAKWESLRVSKMAKFTMGYWHDFSPKLDKLNMISLEEYDQIASEVQESVLCSRIHGLVGLFGMDRLWFISFKTFGVILVAVLPVMTTESSTMCSVQETLLLSVLAALFLGSIMFRVYINILKASLACVQIVASLVLVGLNYHAEPSLAATYELACACLFVSASLLLGVLSMRFSKKFNEVKWELDRIAFCINTDQWDQAPNVSELHSDYGFLNSFNSLNSPLQTSRMEIENEGSEPHSNVSATDPIVSEGEE